MTMQECKKVIYKFMKERGTVMCWSHCHSCSRSQGRFWVHFKQEFENEKVKDYPCQFCGNGPMATYSEYNLSEVAGGLATESDCGDSVSNNDLEFPEDSELTKEMGDLMLKITSGEKTDDNYLKFCDLVLAQEKQKETQECKRSQDEIDSP